MYLVIAAFTAWALVCLIAGVVQGVLIFGGIAVCLYIFDKKGWWV